MPHCYDEELRNRTSPNLKVQLHDHQIEKHHEDDVNDDGHKTTTTTTSCCETNVVDRLLSLADTAARHAPPSVTEASNESPNVVGTKTMGVESHPSVTPSPLNALHRPAHQPQEQQPQQQLPFHFPGPMYSVYHGTKAIVASPIRCRSPATTNHKSNSNDEEPHLETTTPKKPILSKSNREDNDRCASPPLTRKVTGVDHFHRFVPPQHHHPYHQHHSNMLPGSVLLPGSPIHIQRLHNSQMDATTPPFHWSAPYAYLYNMTSFTPTMHADGGGVSHKRLAPPEEREDVPSAKRRLSLPTEETARSLSSESHQSSSREENGGAPVQEPKKSQVDTDIPQNEKAKDDDDNNKANDDESPAPKRSDRKDEKQRVISPSSSNDGGKDEDDEFSNSSGVPPKPVEITSRGGTMASQGPCSYPPLSMMPHPMPHFRPMMRHAMFHPYHQHHHPAMHMGYPPAAFGMHPWYPMGPPGPPPQAFPYSAMSQLGSKSSKQVRPNSPAFSSTTTRFPHRGPPLSPVRSPTTSRETEVVISSASASQGDDGTEAKTNAIPAPLSCTSRASTPESMEPSCIKSVADWQKAAMATGMAPSANRCVPLKAPVPTKYWGEANSVKDFHLPDFHRLVNFPDYLTKSRPNQVEGTVSSASRANGTRHCVMCGKLRLCSASTSQLASNQKNTRKRNDAGDDQDEAGSKPNSPVPAGSTHIIPRQNKGLCTACDVTVWVVTDCGLEIKWCKGCKNFRPWVAFGDKGLATKCVRCRERQREKYALQKEESGRVGRRQNSALTLDNLRRRPCLPPPPPPPVQQSHAHRQPVATTTKQEEDNDDMEDDDHVAAARGLRNLMAASI